MPDYDNYFQPGDRLFSRYEGFDQTIIAIKDGWQNTRLEVAPGAAGPPEHMHESFEERFTVKSGTLSILVNGEKRTVRAGETLAIPPKTRHKPFNETKRDRRCSRAKALKHFPQSSAMSYRSCMGLWTNIPTGQYAANADAALGLR